MAMKNISAVLVGKWVGGQWREGRKTASPMVPNRREIKLQGASGLRDTAPHVLTELSANLRYLRRWQEGQSDLVVGLASHLRTLYEASLSPLRCSDGRFRTSHIFK